MSHTELERLIAAWLDGRISESESEALQSHLRESPEARAVFNKYAQLDAVIREMADGESEYLFKRDEVISRNALAHGSRQPATSAIRPRSLAAIAAAIIIVLTASLYLQHRKAERRIAEVKESTRQLQTDPFIARIIGLSGSLIWTGDRGEIVRNVKVGTELSGGTIEGIAPDSWFELEFNDGSTVMISGTSMLTFADLGQKQLRLREGRLSAHVVPQPEGKPMLIHTRSALLEVLGTQFDVEADLTSTVLNVNEGKVRLRRLSDGSEVDVPAKHLVVAEDERELTPERVPDSVHRWKSQLHRGPGGYGKWLPATAQQIASQKAIPLVPSENPKVTLYLLSIPVSRSDSSPVVVQPDSRFVVRGRLNKPAKVYFGIGMRHVNGEFAGKFRGDFGDRQPISALDSDGQFEIVYRLGDFTLDPCVRDRKDELAARPEGLALDAIWAFTNTGGPSGLEITEVELIPPSNM